MLKKINKENAVKVINLVKKNKKEIAVGTLVVAANIAGVMIGVALYNEFADHTQNDESEVAGLIEAESEEEIQQEVAEN